MKCNDANRTIVQSRKPNVSPDWIMISMRQCQNYKWLTKLFVLRHRSLFRLHAKSVCYNVMPGVFIVRFSLANGVNQLKKWYRFFSFRNKLNTQWIASVIVFMENKTVFELHQAPIIVYHEFKASIWYGVELFWNILKLSNQVWFSWILFVWKRLNFPKFETIS